MNKLYIKCALLIVLILTTLISSSLSISMLNGDTEELFIGVVTLLAALFVSVNLGRFILTK